MDKTRLDIVVIVFKYELEGQPEVAQGLSNLCQETAQIGSACVYVPKVGRADEVIALLEKHYIRFGLHQSRGQAKQELHDN